MDPTGAAQVAETVWCWRGARPPDSFDPPPRRRRGRPTLLPLGELVQPVVVLAILGALERAEASVRDPVPTSVAGAGPGCSIADVLAFPAPGSPPVAGALLRHLTGWDPAAAVRELVTAPLAVASELVLDERGAGRASARALGSVLRAWLRLTQGGIEPALEHLSPAMVRRAWAAASRLVVADGTGVPTWHGPGFVRNVGAVLAPGASPLAFGRIDSGARACALALCDPCAGAVVVVLRRPGGTAATLRARADELLA
jgi:hypothetical protein